MLESEDSVNVKKRKPGGSGYNEEDSPVKTAKLKVSMSGPGDESSQSKSQSQSQLQSQSESQSQSQPSQGSAVQEGLEENVMTLELRSGNVYNRLIDVFAKDTLPKKITYNGNSYNLTELYDEFWSSFYKSSQHSRGFRSKVPLVRNLTDLEIKSLSKIIKRGWEDERYWPKRLSPTFLENIIFQGKYRNEFLTPDTILEFVEQSENEAIQNVSRVDQDVLDIFNKYFCGNTMCLGEDIRESCIKAAIKIMILDMSPIINIWREYLNGLMPIEKFRFLMKESSDLGQIRTVDMLDYIPPHQLWHTFFYGWPDDKIKFYRRLLQNEDFGLNCKDCDWQWYFNARHFISACEGTRDTTRLERHDAVLKILDTKLHEAINRGRGYFSTGTEWKVITMYGNKFYKWPNEDLGVSFDYQYYPHMLAYSLSPKKKLLLIEHTISWETTEQTVKEKEEKYLVVKEELEKQGFEVGYWVHKLGSRGVRFPELYDLLENYFGMEHSEISKTMEDISQQVIHTHYESYKEKGLGLKPQIKKYHGT